MRSEREYMVKSNQARALWPYLVVLTILFVLSLAAPRTWDRAKPEPVALPPQAAVPVPTRLQAKQQATMPATSPLQPVVVNKVTQQYTPQAEVTTDPAPPQPPLLPLQPLPSASPSETITPQPTLVPPAPAAELSLTGPALAPITLAPSPEFEQQLARAEQDWLATREQIRVSWEQARQGLTSFAAPLTQVLRPDVLARFVATRVRANRALAAARLAEPPLPGQVGMLDYSAGLTNTTPTELQETWPLASELIARCGTLRQDPATQPWANQTISLLETLATKSLHDPAGRELLLGLRQLTMHAQAMLVRLGNVTDEALPLRRVHYDLVRRLELWEPLARRSAEIGPWASCIVPSAERDTRVLKPTQTLLDYLATDPAGVTWRMYLQVDTIHDLARINDPIPAIATKRVSHGFPHGDVTQPVAKLINDRRTTAERILARAGRPELSAAQRAFLTRAPLDDYLNALRNWAVQPRLLADLLQTIETYEESRLPSDAANLGQTIADLNCSLDARDRGLGKLLDQHYRNANARLTMTQAMLNRMIPKQAPTNEWVHEQISGTQAHGRSTTSNDVRLQLVPKNDAWGFVFDIAGHVDSSTTSTAGPVTFVNQGASQYTAEKPVELSRLGIQTSPARAFAVNRTQLADMRTEYDNVPLIGGIVRNVAEQKHAESRAAAQQEISRRVANKAAAKVDREVDARLTKMEARIREQFVQRLVGWGLDPTILSLQSTSERATARFRLAGAEQLASHTARPLAMSDSLSSMQVHESVLNNFLEQLQVRGRTWQLPELFAHFQSKMNRTAQTLPDDLPENVTIRFADDDAIVVHCEDGQIQFVVALAELRQGRQVWENVEFHVAYKLNAAGRQLFLERQGVVSLRGDHTGRVDMVLRTIGSRIFPRDKALPLLPDVFLKDERMASLAWSYVQCENGWLGLSMADEAVVLARQRDTVTK